MMGIKNAIALLPRAAAVLGVNAIPAAGWLREVWPAETALLLYYLETAAVVVLVGLLVRLAVPDTDELGRSIGRKRDTLARDYWLVLGGFVAVIGVFVAFFFVLLRVPVDWRAVGVAMALILALQFISYGWELFRLRPLDFADAERLVNRDMGRVAVLHLGVFFGVFLAAARAEWFVWPFIALKTLVDVGMLWEQFNGRFRVQTERVSDEIA